MNNRQDNLPKGWEIKKLGEVCDFKSGTTISPTLEREFGDVLYVKVGDMNLPKNEIEIKTSSRYVNSNEIKQVQIIPEGAVIFPKRGGAIATNKKRKVIQPTIVDLNTMAIIPTKKLDAEYFYYWFQMIDLNDISNGTTIPQINNYSFDEIFIKYPNYLPEQQRIVSILDEAFAAIAKAKANAEQNLKNAKELFESYIEKLFIKLFQANQTKTVSELAKVIGGYSFKSTDFKNAGRYQVIRMGNVRPGTIRENESPVFIDEVDGKVLAKALLQPNDVIITQTGTKNKRDYGFTVVIEKDNYLLNQRIASIRFTDKYLPKFFLYFSWTNIFKDQYFENEKGTVGQGNVGIGAITGAIVPFIPTNEQKLIVDKIDQLRIETQKLEAVYQQKIADLEELKKSLLQKAFSGEL